MWFQSHSTMAVRILIVLSTMAGVIAFVDSTLDEQALNMASRAKRSSTVCSNAACISAAEDLLNYMDQGIKPCDDFYKFACGKFLQNTVIGEDEVMINTLSSTQKHVEENLKKLLEQTIHLYSPKYENFLRTYYQLCMDTEIIERTGATYLKNLLYKYGGWPLISQNWDENVDLTKVLIKIRLDLNNGLFWIFTERDASDTSKYILLIMKKNSVFPKEFYKDDSQKNKIEALKQYIINVAKQLMGNIYLNNLEKDVEDILNFDKNLAEISLSPEESRLVGQEKTTLDKLVTLFNKAGPSFEKYKFVIEIEFDDFVGKLLGKVNIEAKKEEPIAVYEYSFFKGLAELLEKTPKRVVINYLLWDIVNSLIFALPKEFEYISTQYNSVILGSSMAIPRWKTCIRNIAGDLYTPLGALYAKSYFRQSAKIKVERLITDLKNSFHSMILQLPLLLSDTKFNAIEKLLNMRNMSGYPDYFDEENLFADLFADANEPQTLLSVFLAASSIRTVGNLNLLKTPANPKKPDTPIAIANAAYVNLVNSIYIPAGILQTPFFSESLPMYLNYGGIGFVIGHEITHGFDDSGKNYNKDGSAVNWWKDEDEQMFINASQCFVEQYNNFVEEDLNVHVNGRLTLGENIADNGAIREAFLAYQNWIKDNGEEPSLPGLPYNPLQMFFINFGRSFCEKCRPEYALKMIYEDNHSPGRFRILAPLQNFEEFSKTFNCPIGSPMNPIRKCRVW